MNNSFNSGDFKTAMFADCLANSKEIYQLIDQVFPLDSCRHYQVLPLKVDNRRLVLGMLDPKNQESKNFANSIAKVFKYDLEVQLIDLQTHQIILANYPQNATQFTRQQQNQDQNQTIIDTSFNPNAPLKGVNQPRVIDAAPTIISCSPESLIDEDELDIELPDFPADLDFLKDLDLTPQPKEQQAKASVDATATLFEIPPEFKKQNPVNNQAPEIKKAPVDATATLFEIPPEFRQQNSTNNLNDQATIITDYPTDLLTPKSFNNQEIDAEEAQRAQLIAETLGQTTSIQLESATTDFLPGLLPELSWSKLLEQAYQNHSEYITLTRYSDRGGIVTEKDNSPQSSVNRVPLPIFCSLIDEIKRMARLPQDTSNHPQKLVLERFYDQERILLRIEFSVQQQLEAVRIQILRDQALKIYEQQQMDRVGEQALELAKQLEKTLRKIQACFDSAKLTNLRELQAVHSRINHQLRLLDQ